jgi:hypothetical protein
MPLLLATHPLLSVAGGGEARRFLPEAAELLPRGIPARLRPRSFPTLFPFLTRGSHAGELRDCGRVPLDGLTDGHTHNHAYTLTHACAH